MARARVRPAGPQILFRQGLMLRLLPRAPRTMDAARLEEGLAAQGVTIDWRSIERDLQRLSAVFPLVCDDRTKPSSTPRLRGHGNAEAHRPIMAASCAACASLAQTTRRCRAREKAT